MHTHTSPWSADLKKKEKVRGRKCYDISGRLGWSLHFFACMNSFIRIALMLPEGIIFYFLIVILTEN